MEIMELVLKKLPEPKEIDDAHFQVGCVSCITVCFPDIN